MSKLYDLQMVGGSGLNPCGISDRLIADHWRPCVEQAERVVRLGGAGVFLRAAAGHGTDLPAQEYEIGPARDGAMATAEVWGWPDAEAAGQGWLVDEFAEAWSPLIRGGSEVIAMIGAVPWTWRSHTLAQLRHWDAPYIGAGAGVCYDSAGGLKARPEPNLSSPTFRLAADRKSNLKRVYAEPVAQLDQMRAWQPAVHGFAVQVVRSISQRRISAGSTDRMSTCYANPDEWALRRDLDEAGLRKLALVVIDDRDARLRAMREYLADGWRVCGYTFDLTDSEITEMAAT